MGRSAEEFKKRQTTSSTSVKVTRRQKALLRRMTLVTALATLDLTSPGSTSGGRHRIARFPNGKKERPARAGKCRWLCGVL